MAIEKPVSEMPNAIQRYARKSRIIVDFFLLRVFMCASCSVLCFRCRLVAGERMVYATGLHVNTPCDRDHHADRIAGFVDAHAYAHTRTHTHTLAHLGTRTHTDRARTV